MPVAHRDFFIIAPYKYSYLFTYLLTYSLIPKNVGPNDRGGKFRTGKWRTNGRNVCSAVGICVVV